MKSTIRILLTLAFSLQLSAFSFAGLREQDLPAPAAIGSGDSVRAIIGGTSAKITLANFATSLGALNVFQPLDADLSAIALLTTGSFGRSLLTGTSADQVVGWLGIGSGSSAASGTASYATAAGTASTSGSAALAGIATQSAESPTLQTARLAGILSIPNCTLWVAADAISGTNGQSVSTWPDLSGSGNNLTLFSGTAPVYSPNGANGKPTLQFAGTLMSTGSTFFSSAYDKAFSVFIVLQRTGTSTASRRYFMSDKQAGDYTYGFESWAMGLEYSAGSHTNYHFHSGLGTDAQIIANPAELTIRAFTYDGTNYKTSISGKYFQTTALTGTMGCNGGLYLGNNSPATSAYDGNISELLVYRRGLTDAERQTIERYLINKWGLNRQQIVFLGDSRTENGSEIPLRGIANQVQAILGGAAVWHVEPLGISGRESFQVLADCDGQLKSGYRPGATNVAVDWVGVNDITLSETAANIYLHIAQTGTIARANGYKFVACTEVPHGSDSGQETTRQTLNTNIRANWRLFADALADFGADPIMGVNGVQSNTTYYLVDTIHPKDAGTAILARLEAKAIQYALGLTVTGTAALVTGTAIIADPNITTSQTIIPSVSGTGILTPLIVSAQVTGTATITSGTNTDNGTIRYTITP